MRGRAERLLHDDAPRLGQARLGQALDHRTEQERRDLEVEHRGLGTGDRLTDALERRGVTEIAAHVGQPRGEAIEDRVIDLLSAALDRCPSMAAEIVRGPVADGHPHDRAGEQPALLEPVERMECHHLREVPRDPEDHEHVGGLLECAGRRRCRRWARADCSAHRCPPCRRRPEARRPSGSLGASTPRCSADGDDSAAAYRRLASPDPGELAGRSPAPMRDRPPPRVRVRELRSG